MRKPTHERIPLRTELTRQHSFGHQHLLPTWWLRPFLLEDRRTLWRFSPDGAFAYVACESGVVSVIDTASNTVVNNIPVELSAD